MHRMKWHWLYQVLGWLIHGLWDASKQDSGSGAGLCPASCAVSAVAAELCLALHRRVVVL